MWEKQIRLTLRRMLEAAVGDGAKKLSLEQEVAETSRVDSNVAALLVGTISSDCEVLFRLSISRGGSCASRDVVCCGDVLVRVIDEIFFVRHGDGRGVWVEVVKVWQMRSKRGVWTFLVRSIVVRGLAT